MSIEYMSCIIIAMIPVSYTHLDVYKRQQLAGAEVELVSVVSRETMLKKALASVRDTYDFIVIDCPPVSYTHLVAVIIRHVPHILCRPSKNMVL